LFSHIVNIHTTGSWETVQLVLHTGTGGAGRGTTEAETRGDHGAARDPAFIPRLPVDTSL
jgi:hypothetical protein